MKRLLAEGLPRIFQIVPCFRRGEIGGRHNPEFTMLEWYRSGMSADEMMSETEDLVRLVLDVPTPFRRLTVQQAYRRYADVERDALLAMAQGDEETFFRLLVDRVEPALAALEVPVFLHDYPASQASLARRKPSDPDWCERFELYVKGVELCNGFGELTDPVEQRARLEEDQRKRRAANKPVYPIDEKFLAALEGGMPDAAGNALGLDRLIALVAGADAIGDVMAFSAFSV